MLKQRVITAVLAGIVVLIVLLFGEEIGWRWLVWLCTVAGVAEFSTMFGARWLSISTILSALVVTLIEWFPVTFNHPIYLYLVVAIVLVSPVLTRDPGGLRTTSVLAFGALYIAAGGLSLTSLRALPVGWFWMWLFLIAVWMSDTAAYFVGKAMRGPKLLPEISPGKTVSGMLGGIVGGAVGAVVFGWIAHPVYNGWMFAAVGAIISLAEQLGDLVESAYKRVAGVKDSGRMLPGHGGILDRIDGLIFAAPIAFWLIDHGIRGWFG
ncbi:phosphatidate cytidylyltransferase [Alicyclobacillus acidiphilus]|uniref:phosphatidate cytidylyltransferase n=1 Tax=Alicyclobacillus acidiphilus TaxID=182455 RepID=UPI00082A7D32|nr:phosphatidate cytidylyltransferase [Alicyclobacillus acidiphilus]